MTDQVLLLAPSHGLGGGVERYAETLEWAFSAQGIKCGRVDLRCAGVVAHARMLAESRSLLRADSLATRLIVVHRALLPVAAILAKERSVNGTSVVCHGSDVWGARYRPRRYVESHLMQGSGVRVVAVGSFTAGALSGDCQATILPPGLSDKWFHMLVEASNNPEQREHEVQMVTAFRLSHWREKGLPQLLESVAALGSPGVRVTICGSGSPSPELETLVRRYSNCVLRPSLTDYELARQLAAADLFVLATRTRPGRRPSGEGFGLVLLEAQVAGTAVVSPAHGGSYDAYVDGMTGVAPTDESISSLTGVLAGLLKDRQRLEQMGLRAAEWARECFAPANYGSRAVQRLL